MFAAKHLWTVTDTDQSNCQTERTRGFFPGRRGPGEGGGRQPPQKLERIGNGERTVRVLQAEVGHFFLEISTFVGRPLEQNQNRVDVS